MDIKHTNPAKHKEFTGRANDLMMENARKVALSGKCKLIIRVPVIPTFNDTVEEIQGIATFCRHPSGCGTASSTSIPQTWTGQIHRSWKRVSYGWNSSANTGTYADTEESSRVCKLPESTDWRLIFTPES